MVFESLHSSGFRYHDRINFAGLVWGSFVATGASISTNNVWTNIEQTYMNFTLGQAQQILISYQLMLDGLLSRSGDPMPR
jgi:hypothetical protein